MSPVCFFIVSVLFWSLAQGAEVSAVSGKNIQIKLAADDFLEPKEKYLLIDERNKKVGIVSISSVAETEGQALLLKGTAKIGYKLQLWTPPQTTSPAAAQKTSQVKNFLGVSLDVMMNQMTLTFGSTTIAMKGQSVGFSLAYQNSLTAELKMRYSVGYRSFAVKATDPLCLQNSCELAVSFITAGARADYFLNDAVFVGGGLDYLSTSSKSSSVLNTDQIQNNSLAAVAVGAVIDSQFPMALTYNHFLQNKDAASSFIALQIGYLFPF